MSLPREPKTIADVVVLRGQYDDIQLSLPAIYPKILVLDGFVVQHRPELPPMKHCLEPRKRASEYLVTR